MVEDAHDDPYEGLAPLLELVAQWLARSSSANVPLELAAHELRSRGDWRLSIHRTGREIEGVSIVMPGGRWFVEANGPAAAGSLTNAAVIRGRHPTTLVTTERVAALIRPLLAEHGAVAGEHTLRVLTCTKAPAVKEGRWAAGPDLRALETYQEQIEAEHRQRMDTSWDSLIARKELAVLVRDDAVVASVRRYGPAPSFAGIADLYMLPQVGRSEIGSHHLAAFVVDDILARRKAVHTLVDDSDAATLALYAALGFEQTATLYKADLR